MVWIFLDCGQNKTYEDIILLWETLINIFWHFIIQTTNQLIDLKKLTDEKIMKLIVSCSSSPIISVVTMSLFSGPFNSSRACYQGLQYFLQNTIKFSVIMWKFSYYRIRAVQLIEILSNLLCGQMQNPNSKDCNLLMKEKCDKATL